MIDDGIASDRMTSNDMTSCAARRGQLQAMEPIIITIILVLIIGVALIFYVRINYHEVASDSASFSQEEDLALLSRISSMPELSCPAVDGVPKNCIDLEKARQFQRLTRNDRTRSYYNPVLGATNITIETVDLAVTTAGSAGEALDTINIYQNMQSENRVVVRTYAVVFDPASRTNRFATIIIERERR
jgi:hypothetical protein